MEPIHKIIKARKGGILVRISDADKEAEGAGKEADLGSIRTKAVMDEMGDGEDPSAHGADHDSTEYGVAREVTDKPDHDSIEYGMAKDFAGDYQPSDKKKPSLMERMKAEAAKKAQSWEERTGQKSYDPRRGAGDET